MYPTVANIPSSKLLYSPSPVSNANVKKEEGVAELRRFGFRRAAQDSLHVGTVEYCVSVVRGENCMTGVVIARYSGTYTLGIVDEQTYRHMNNG